MAHILIVDDSPSQLLGLQRVVEKLGHQCSTAEDGAAGVEAAKQLVPDLILMDVVMPNLNGFQATRAISREPTTSHIPVVLVTTKDQETDRVWGMRQGAKGYITKPSAKPNCRRWSTSCWAPRPPERTLGSKRMKAAMRGLRCFRRQPSNALRRVS